MVSWLERERDSETESTSPPPPPPSSLLTKSSKGVKMPADIMRLWSLPLPHPLFFISSPLLCTAHASQLFSSAHFHLPFVGSGDGFTYKSQRYCALYLHRVIPHARRKQAIEIFLPPIFFIVSLIVFPASFCCIVDPEAINKHRWSRSAQALQHNIAAVDIW